MCGIFGWIPYNDLGTTDLRKTVKRVLKSMAHRGPDDYGYAVFDAASRGVYSEKTDVLPESFKCMIGQVRLSIIDLSPSGHQPMFSEGGRYAVVYNGEIYNYIELRSELEKEGVKFATVNDTEVLMKAIVHWGKDALNKFTGMFAFALYDSYLNKLFCARDFFGIKPFYWYRGERGFFFASELPALLEFPEIPRIVDPTSVYNYMVQGRYNVGGESMLKDIYQIPPAHYMEIDCANPFAAEPVRYWKPDLSVQSKLSFADAASHLREMFLNSVRIHLRSDVPLGVALSGGVDSSAVTCAVRAIEPDIDLHTFSFIARGSDVSEEQYANAAARHTNAVRHIVEVEPKEIIDDIDDMIVKQGEPFGSTSIYAQYRVFKLAKECGITVTLDGQGADELFAGYSGYPGQRIASLLCSMHPLKAYQFLKATSQWPGRSVSGSIMYTAEELLPTWVVPLARKTVGKNPYPLWLDVNQIREAGGEASPASMALQRQMYPSKKRVNQRLAYQLTWDGIPRLLRHGDRNAMAHSIESRVPFLTKDMSEFCLSLPEEYLIDMTGKTKSVFKKAMRGIVPDAILDRKDKIGFATPEKDWLFSISGWVDSFLSETKFVPYLKLDSLREEWNGVKGGKVPYSWRVWRCINYIRWMQVFGIQG